MVLIREPRKGEWLRERAHLMFTTGLGILLIPVVGGVMFLLVMLCEFVITELFCWC